MTRPSSAVAAAVITLLMLLCLLAVTLAPSASADGSFKAPAAEGDADTSPEVSIPFEVYKDFIFPLNISPPFQQHCIFNVTHGLTFDVRALTGLYVVLYMHTHEKYRLSLCIEPHPCNGAHDAAVCHLHKVIKVDGFDVVLESEEGRVPPARDMLHVDGLPEGWDSPAATDAPSPVPEDFEGTILRVPYIDGNYAQLVERLQSLMQSAETIAESMLNNKQLDGYLDQALAMTTTLLNGSNPITIMRYICDPMRDGSPDIAAAGNVPFVDGMWDGFLKPNELIPVSTTNVTAFNVSHRCACPFSNCDPPQQSTPAHVCVRAWESHLQSNWPALAIFVLLLLYTMASSTPTVNPTSRWQSIRARLRLPAPVNFLYHRKSRFVYGCVFGSFSSIAFHTVLNVLHSDSSPLGNASILSSMGLMFLLGSALYPMAICHSCPNVLLGSSLGMVYSLIATYLYAQTVSCVLRSSQAYPTGVIMLPTLVCLVLLLGHFLWDFASSIRKVVRVLLESRFRWRLRHRRSYSNEHASSLSNTVPFTSSSSASTSDKASTQISRRIARLLALIADINRAVTIHDDIEHLKFYQTRVRELLVSIRRRDRKDAARRMALLHMSPIHRALVQAKSAIVNRVYRPVSFFRYSPRMLAMAVLATFLLVQCVLLWTNGCWRFAVFVRTVVDGMRCKPLGAIISSSDILDGDSTSSGSDEDESVTDELIKPVLQLIPGLSLVMDFGTKCKTNDIIIQAVYWSFLASGILSAIIHVAFLLHMITCYRKHIRRMCVGDRSFLPRASADMTSAFAIVDGLKYGGFQIAYLLTGWLVVAVIWCLFCLFITFCIVLPILDIYDDILWQPIVLPQMIPVVITVGFYYLQVALVRIFFQRAGRNYTLTNQSLFHNVDFFVFFVNAFLGLYSFIARIALNVGFGLIWIARLDKSMLTRGYELTDPGYRTYVGLLLLDYNFCNPVAITFCRLLSEAAIRNEKHRKEFFSENEPGLRQSQSSALIQEPATPTTPDQEGVALLSSYKYDDEHVVDMKWDIEIANRRRSNLNRNRWFLMVTLINNPLLRDERKDTARRARSKEPERLRQNSLWRLNRQLSKRVSSSSHSSSATPSSSRYRPAAEAASDTDGVALPEVHHCPRCGLGFADDGTRFGDSNSPESKSSKANESSAAAVLSTTPRQVSNTSTSTVVAEKAETSFARPAPLTLPRPGHRRHTSDTSELSDIVGGADLAASPVSASSEFDYWPQISRLARKGMHIRRRSAGCVDEATSPRPHGSSDGVGSLSQRRAGVSFVLGGSTRTSPISQLGSKRHPQSPLRSNFRSSYGGGELAESSFPSQTSLNELDGNAPPTSPSRRFSAFARDLSPPKVVGSAQDNFATNLRFIPGHRRLPSFEPDIAFYPPPDEQLESSSDPAHGHPGQRTKAE